ncbi:MAG: hypothetical protein ACREX3_04915 [Gammaproteobacteria bacterium]
MLSTTQWWRWSRYEIVGEDVLRGGWIVPARNASLEACNPFDEHRELWRRKAKGSGSQVYRELPYVELARLAGEVNQTALGSGELEKRVLDWCNRYGLLGVLRHRTLQAFQWPHWEECEGGVRAVQHQVAGIRAWQNRHVMDLPRPAGADRRPGDPLSEEDAAALFEEAGFLRPCAVVTRPEDEAPEQLRFAEGYAQFFPRLLEQPPSIDGPGRSSLILDPGYIFEGVALDPQEFPYPDDRQLLPGPDMRKFEREYGESVQLFLRYAKTLSRRLELWKSLRGGALWSEIRGQDRRGKVDFPEGEPKDEEERRHRERERQELDGFRSCLETISPVPLFEVVKARPGESWRRVVNSYRFRSLYAAFHLMILMDASGGRRLGWCPVCTEPWSSTQPGRKYCERDSCKNRGYYHDKTQKKLRETVTTEPPT